MSENEFFFQQAYLQPNTCSAFSIASDNTPFASGCLCSPLHLSLPAQPTPQQQQQAGSQQQPQLQQPQVVQVQAPLQVEIGEGTTEAEAQAALTAAGLTPPLLCKPLWTDGRDGSHTLAVLHDLEALGRLLRGQVCSEFKPPLVVQQFVEHGGVLFKVGPVFFGCVGGPGKGLG